MSRNDEVDEQFRRIESIVGSNETESRNRWLDYLRAKLRLPCKVTGIEDFRWEEPFILGIGSEAEYRELRKVQPSYLDEYDLESITDQIDHEWALFAEDIGALVRRESDGARFVLGLSELRAVNDDAVNHEVLDDYAVWIANSR